MAEHFETFLRSVMSGERRGAQASSLRLALSIAEPFYRVITASRNKLFDLNLRKPRKLPVPVISVGNLTTGGTGKTPLVAWIVQALHRVGHSPAVLMRGYKKPGGIASDEEQLYLSRFAGYQPPVQIVASPSRFPAACQALDASSPPNVFVLDDGFQHRQLARDLDLVVIDATHPFGYRHVLPRGMLRESVTGLSRAGAIVITRSDQVLPEQLASLTTEARRLNPSAPVFNCWNELEEVESLKEKRLFAFCGIGNPESFWLLLNRAGLILAGTQAFNDHQHYSRELLDSLASKATVAGADILVTTEKDWPKIHPVAAAGAMPITSVRMNVKFNPADEAELLAILQQVAIRIRI